MVWNALRKYWLLNVVTSNWRQTEFLLRDTFFFFFFFFYFCDRLLSCEFVRVMKHCHKAHHLSTCLYLSQYCCVRQPSGSTPTPVQMYSTVVTSTASYKACEPEFGCDGANTLKWFRLFFWRPAPQQQKKAVNTIKDKTHYAISNVGFTLKPHMQFLHSAYSNISIELHSAKPCNLSALRKKLRNQTAQEQIAWFYIPWCLNRYEITTISKTRCNVRPCRRDLQAT